jgi:hypothetical protein
VTVIFRTYSDDSGSHLQSPVSLLGGLTGKREAWIQFESDWKHLLSKWSIRYFKSSEQHVCQGEFKNWDHPKRDACVGEFLDLIVSYPIVGISVAIKRSDIVPLFQGMEYEPALEYAMLLTYILAKVEFATSLHERYADAQHEFFFDQQEDVVIASMLMRAVKRMRGRIASVTFADSKKVLPLQAADMLAWATRRRFLYPSGEPTRMFKRIEKFSLAEMISKEVIESSVGELLRSVVREVTEDEKPDEEV